jgi:hypothetical protein
MAMWAARVQSDFAALPTCTAAVPGVPGWGFALTNYYTSVSAGADVTAARLVTLGELSPTTQFNLNAHLKATGEVGYITPSYIFATPIFGGQLGINITAIPGVSTGDISGVLTTSIGGLPETRQFSIDEARAGFGDLYPQATLKWNSGVNNWMIYGEGDIPVGMYNSNSLANLGIGHGAADGGVGYTYFDQQTGHEFSAVTGATYNLVNQHTHYQNGIDWHLDWGASQFLTKQFSIGALGYFYQQLTSDRGCHPQLCPFKSSVIGIRPQATYLFPVAGMQGYLNLKVYGDVYAHDRPTGWNAWVTLAVSPRP